MIKNVKLDIDFEEIKNVDYNIHQGSCIQHQVTELTDIHEKYGGFPSTYRFSNTLIHQVWFDKDKLDYETIGEQLNIDVVTISAIKQPPGCVIPLHRDTFYQINTKYPKDTREKVRANIFLGDSEIGHIIQYKFKEEVITLSEWKQGEGVLWNNRVEHIGANIGMTPKYTLQVSGFLL